MSTTFYSVKERSTIGCLSNS